MFEIIVLLLAGIGAGIVTGLVGASAVVIAAPLLIISLDYPAYLAIGIALSIDVFASFFATVIYHKHGNLKIKQSLILLIPALIAVVIASYFSKYIPSANLGFIAGLGTLIGGILITRKKSDLPEVNDIIFLKKYKTFSLIVIGLLIGTIAGAFGAGGGVMILLALTLILNYGTHKAIGTSIFLMIFIALFGGISHYVNMPFSLYSLLIAGAGGILGALGASKIANIIEEKTLKIIVGVVIVTLGTLLMLKNIPFL